MATATNVIIQRDTGNRLAATWTWSKANTESFSVRWWYMTSLQIPYLAEESTVSNAARSSTYTMPEDAIKVWFTVKPVAEKNNDGAELWVADWSIAAEWYDTSQMPETPPTPTVSISDDGLYLTASVSNAGYNYGSFKTMMEYQVVATQVSGVAMTGDPFLFYDQEVLCQWAYSSISIPVDESSTYRVRCRIVQYPGSSSNANFKVRYSEWSQFSSDVNTRPGKFFIIGVRATSRNSVYLYWNTYIYAQNTEVVYEAVNNRSGYIEQKRYPITELPEEIYYNLDFWTPLEPDDIANPVLNHYTFEIEYANDISYFDGSNRTTTIPNITLNHYEITGLEYDNENNNEYYFRVRGSNSNGTSEWSNIVKIVIGEAPDVPTTWSSTTTAVIGEPLKLYWVHNSKDNSSQTEAEIEIKVGLDVDIITIQNTDDPYERDKTSEYSLTTSAYSDGEIIQWRVRTAGAIGVYGEWSVQRSINIYSKPTVTVMLINGENESVTIFDSFPIYVYAVMNQTTQNAIGYHVSIIANNAYVSYDNIGNAINIPAGGEIYSKYIDIQNNTLNLEINPWDINLANNSSYTIYLTATMDSGLVAKDELSFIVALSESYLEPNAEIGLNKDTVSVYLRPYCVDGDEELIEDVVLSVYRREFDGSFTEIASNIDNALYITVTDPHPSLNFARYRIVAMSKTTGSIGYYDMPSYPVHETSIIIQWNDIRSTYNSDTQDLQMATLPYNEWDNQYSSFIKLPYNIDVSEKTDIDVELVDYIGRKHPVSYYGTQLGESAVWNTEIPKSDIETIYALRRLSIWTGDVYVREPSGTGYWANISVTFNTKHLDVTIPITLSITRVEGGI